jgi:mannitol-1-phosphate 5-dehydrogenase
VSKTFVGIGFGPIQSGLFLLEAQTSRNFERFVVAEVLPSVVDAIRRGGGECSVNVASARGITTHAISGVEVYNPLDRGDAERLVEAIAEADEIATALPSVMFFDRGTPSPATLLARGFERKLADARLPTAIVYAAENHNHAAELLRESVLRALFAADRTRLDDRVQFLNTVIGKMSGVVNDRRQIEQDGLSPLVASGDSAVLVEEFCRILISQITLPEIQRGIEVFQEKADLLPFEEAKLYGHNAAHALLGYFSHRRGLAFIHEAASSELLPFVEAAFLEESGGALCRRHANIDELFTTAGWSAYVQDLLVRMVNPFLKDRVDRVIRDPRRKLAWNDRLVGTMRLALQFDIRPARYAAGARAAAELLQQEYPTRDIPALLSELWHDASPPESERDAIIEQICRANAAIEVNRS